MIIYNGRNDELKRALSPLEITIQGAAKKVLGARQFRELDGLSNALLVPAAFYEPDVSTAVSVLDDYSEAKDTSEKRPYDYVQFAAGFLELNRLNDAFADEFVRRIAYHAGLNCDEWQNRFKKLNEENPEPEDARRASLQLENYIHTLSDDKFAEAIVNWQNGIAQWAAKNKLIGNAVRSLSGIKFSKRAPLEEVVSSVAFSLPNDFSFGIGIDAAKLRMNVSGVFSLNNSSKLYTTPAFSLPRSYNPEEIYLFQPKDPSAFMQLAFLHEYGHFVQYALQPVPLQAVASIMYGAATSMIKEA